MNTAVTVPTIYKRTTIPEEAINAIVKQIITLFHPQKIYLFGSYAWGQPTAESDVDLLVIMDTPLRGTEQSIQISQKIDYQFGLDLLVYTPKNFLDRINLGDTFLKEILQKGKILYESTDA